MFCYSAVVGYPESSSVQVQKSARAREKIFRAVTSCLVDIGYADTSISRVAERSGMSRGAIQHHFLTNEDMMAATAEYILGNATFLHLRNVRGPRATRSVGRELQRSWDKGANTDEFRALLEILVKMRTDSQLRSRLASPLQQWHEQAAALTLEGYESTRGQPDDVSLLMAMNACLIRGLVIQQQYTDDPAFLGQIMGRWIDLVSPLLRPRSEVRKEN